MEPIVSAHFRSLYKLAKWHEMMRAVDEGDLRQLSSAR